MSAEATGIKKVSSILSLGRTSKNILPKLHMQLKNMVLTVSASMTNMPIIRCLAAEL